MGGGVVIKMQMHIPLVSRLVKCKINIPIPPECRCLISWVKDGPYAPTIIPNPKFCSH